MTANGASSADTMDIDTRKLRNVSDYGFDEAGRLNSAEVVVALFEAFDVPYDAGVVASRGQPIHTDDLRAILTAYWLDRDREGMHAEAAAQMEALVHSLAPTGE